MWTSSRIAEQEAAVVNAGNRREVSAGGPGPAGGGLIEDRHSWG